VERRYQQKYDAEKLARALRNRQPGPMTVQTVKAIQAKIIELYGAPLMVYETGYPKPIHDELIAFLFAPPTDSISQR
jgi:hypothetical protein